MDRIGNIPSFNGWAVNSVKLEVMEEPDFNTDEVEPGSTWIDNTRLINGRTMVFYYNNDNDQIDSFII